MRSEVWAVGLVVLSSIVSAGGAFFLKVGADRSKFHLRSLRVDPRVVIGISLYFVGSVLYILALRGGELSVLYPIAALVYVWSTALAKWRLNERINLHKILGLMFLLGGITLITLAGR